MKIGFILGSPDINGGTYVIYEHSSRLKRQGHDVALITEEPVTPERYAWHNAAHELEWLTFSGAQDRSFDIVLATHWQSPFLLSRLRAKHYVYFVQSIESRFFEPRNRQYPVTGASGFAKHFCESTYSYAIPMITEAKWIQEYIYQRFNNTPFLVRNGIRKDLYHPDGPTLSSVLHGKLRVLIEGSVDVPYKNVPKTIELCQKAGVDEIWLLTSSEVEEIAGVDRVFSRVPIDETPPIYRSCDVLVKLSYVEGMFGPPLEMFHCGGTSLVYNVTGHDEYIVHEQNSYVVDRDDEQQVIKYLQKLKKNPATLQRLKQGASQTADKWPDWETASARFADALLKIAQGRETSRQYIKRQRHFLFNWSRLYSHNRILYKLIRRERSRSDAPVQRDDYCQLFWHGGEQFNAGNVQGVSYKSDEWTTIAFEVITTNTPFWLRIDHSVEIGMLLIDDITVTNSTSGAQVMRFGFPDGPGELTASGTAHLLENREDIVVYSYGFDPMLILPPVQNLEIGTRLRVTTRFKSISVREFLVDKEDSGGCPTSSTMGWQGLKSKIRRFMMTSFFLRF